MKLKGIILFTTLLVGYFSCTKDDNPYKSSGIITGRDYTFNTCTAGWIIKIDSVKYLFDTIPSTSNFVLNVDSLPIIVKLDWQLVNNGCPMKRIIIERIRKQ